MFKIFIVSFSVLTILGSCDSGGNVFEKEFEKKIDFKISEVTKKINLINFNSYAQSNFLNANKPSGRFFAFEKKVGLYSDISLRGSGDINLQLEKVNLLALNRSSINSFVLLIVDELKYDGDYSGVKGYKEYGRIFFINPTNFNVEYVESIDGGNSFEKVIVNKSADKAISSPIGPVQVVNAIKGY